MTVAVIGLGAWGKHHARIFASLGELAAVCSHDAGADAWQDYPVRSLGAILADPDIKGVVVATPTPSHFSITQQALLAGKHVFVEKPMTQSADEAHQLVALAKDKGLVLMVGHLIRYHPCFQHVLSLVAEGYLGALKDVHFRRTNFGKFRDYESAFRDIAPHDGSMLLALFNAMATGMGQGSEGGSFPPLALEALDWRVEAAGLQLSGAFGGDLPKEQLEDQILLTFRSRDGGGVRGSLFFSRIWPLKEQSLVIQGTKGCLVFDDTKPWEQKLMVGQYQPSSKDDAMPSDPYSLEMKPVAVTVGEPLRQECEHFLSCVGKNGEDACLTPGKDGATIASWMASLGL